MDYKLLLDTAVMAGEILLESGAETWRVEDTMLRMLRMSGLKTADVLALTTGFVVTLDDPAMDSMTVMRSVESRATDLNRIHAVNQLSAISAKEISTWMRCSTGCGISIVPSRKLKKSARDDGDDRRLCNHVRSRVLRSAGICTCRFYIRNRCLRRKKAGMQSFLVNCIGSFLLAVTSILCVHYLPGTMDLNVIIIASIMPSYRVWRSRMRCMIPCTATTFPVRHGCLRRL